MVRHRAGQDDERPQLSVLALSSRFDGPYAYLTHFRSNRALSVLALSSRFDGQIQRTWKARNPRSFSTRSVESF